jgi:hypothetical protein
VVRFARAIRYLRVLAFIRGIINSIRPWPSLMGNQELYMAKILFQALPLKSLIH